MIYKSQIDGYLISWNEAKPLIGEQPNKPTNKPPKKPTKQTKTQKTPTNQNQQKLEQIKNHIHKPQLPNNLHPHSCATRGVL